MCILSTAGLELINLEQIWRFVKAVSISTDIFIAT